MKAKSSKELAERIDPSYHARRHPFRAWRTRISAIAAALALLFGAWVSAGDRRAIAAGPVSSRHALFEADCEKCHAEAFSRVKDDSCVSCHAAPPHAPPAKARDPRCASCHAEHRGREFLDRVPDARCNGCHAHHEGIEELAGHAPFRVEARDQRIRFPHDRHLKPDLKEGPLACGDCHLPDARGESFEPVAFEARCERCHALHFDADRGSEKAPHGLDGKELRLRTSAFQLGEMRKGLGELNPRRPARDEEAAFDERVEGSMRLLRAKCAQCHAMEGEEVVAPAIPADWMPLARFSHETHRFEKCDRCHDLSGNDRAEVLSLPAVETCRECHKPGGARTGCVTCHPYHRPPR